MTNAERYERAARALDYYAQVQGEPVRVAGAETVITDLLTDLMHYCDENGIDFQARVSMADTHHEAELTEDSDK